MLLWMYWTGHFLGVRSEASDPRIAAWFVEPSKAPLVYELFVQAFLGGVTALEMLLLSVIHAAMAMKREPT